MFVQLLENPVLILFTPRKNVCSTPSKFNLEYFTPRIFTLQEKCILFSNCSNSKKFKSPDILFKFKFLDQTPSIPKYRSIYMHAIPSKFF